MRDHLIKEQNFTFLRCHTLYNSIVIFQNIYCRMVHQIQILIDWSLCLLSQVKCLKKKASNPVEVSLSFLFTILQKYFNVNLFLFCFFCVFVLFFILYFFFDLIYCVWSLDVIQKTMITHQKKKKRVQKYYTFIIISNMNTTKCHIDFTLFMKQLRILVPTEIIS